MQSHQVTPQTAAFPAIKRQSRLLPILSRPAPALRAELPKHDPADRILNLLYECEPATRHAI
jgi:hypothetical protein